MDGWRDEIEPSCIGHQFHFNERVISRFNRAERELVLSYYGILVSMQYIVGW